MDKARRHRRSRSRDRDVSESGSDHGHRSKLKSRRPLRTGGFSNFSDGPAQAVEAAPMGEPGEPAARLTTAEILAQYKQSNPVAGGGKSFLSAA